MRSTCLLLVAALAHAGVLVVAVAVDAEKAGPAAGIVPALGHTKHRSCGQTRTPRLCKYFVILNRFRNMLEILR